MFVQYWSMRVMAYLGGIAVLIALWGVFLLWRRKLDDRAPVPPGGRRGRCVLPFIIDTAGWVLTENGRQPWIVQGLMLTRTGCHRR